ncbi:MAG: hypothetical protein ACREFO_00845 [Acetobacteraceae bacterium]
MPAPSAKNVIILTSGLSGSSVLAGLLVRAGFWPGSETFKKQDYETFENCELIRLNMRLIQEAGYAGDYASEFSDRAIEDVAHLVGKVDDGLFRALVKECEQHRPWIWKDPRLWLTIRFWATLIDPEDCHFVLLTRALLPLWLSTLRRRQITTYRYLRHYEAKVQGSIIGFLDENRLPYLHLRYEALIARPNEAIAQLNHHFGTVLGVDDFKAVHTARLRNNPALAWVRHAEALLIYARNYSERRDLEQR